MPLIISAVNGEKRIVEGDSWRKADESSSRLGEVILHDLNDGHRTYANKSNLVFIDEFSKENWDAEVKNNQLSQAAQRKAQARQQAQAQRDAYHRRSWFWRLFHKCPVTLPVDLAG